MSGILLKLGRRLALSKISGRPRLLLASLYPSFACNLRCSYCNLPNRQDRELSLEQWLGILDQLADLGVVRVNFLGGEPLLYGNLPALLERCRERGIAAIVTSNGFLVPKRLDWLRLASGLVLSLDAAGPAVDQIRGPGAWAAVQAALDSAQAAGLPVSLNAVLSADTAGELPGLLEYSRRRGLPLSVNTMRSGNPGLWGTAMDHRIEAGELRGLLGRLAELAKSQPQIRFSPATYERAAQWPDWTRDFLEAPLSDEHKIALRRMPGCSAGRHYLYILPGGTAVPCLTRWGAGPEANAAELGVRAAWEAIQKHACLACPSACMLELNHLFALKPSVIMKFIRPKRLRPSS